MTTSLRCLALLLLFAAPCGAIDFSDPNTRFFTVQDFSYQGRDGRQFFSASGYYTPQVGDIPARVSILPRVGVELDDIQAIDIEGNKTELRRRSDVSDIASLNVPVSYLGANPNDFEGAAIHAAVNGQRLDAFHHWPMADQDGQPDLYRPAQGSPVEKDVRAAVRAYIEGAASKHREHVEGWRTLRVETASMDGLTISLLIDGEIVTERSLYGSAIMGRKRLPVLAVKDPDLSTYNRIRQGTFEVELSYQFIDRKVGSIEARYDYARMMSNFIEQSRQAFTRSRSSGWKFFGIGSRRRSISQSIRESDERTSRFESSSNTTVQIEDAPDSLIAQFEANFFPSLSKRRAREAHFEAERAARQEGNTKLAEAHLAYATSLQEEGNQEMEAKAMAEAAVALNSGNYAMFLAKGVRFHDNKGSASGTFHRVLSQEATEEGERSWSGTSTRSVMRTVSVILAPQDLDDQQPWLGLVSAVPMTFPFFGPRGREEHQFVVPTCIIAGSPLAQAGVRQGMMIRSIGGREVGSLDDYQDALADYEPGDQIEVKYLTEQRRLEELSVEVGVRARSAR